MRKFFFLSLLAAGLMTAGMTVSAQTGDVIGNVYSTDILAKVNGIPIPSYSLNGKTAIALRDLEHYGFYVSYHDNHRTALIEIDLTGDRDISPIAAEERGTPGEIVGNVLETDISAYINGEYVPTCNIDGRLAAAIEDVAPRNDGSEFAEYGYAKTGLAYDWDEQSRTIDLITIPANNEYEAQRLAAENMLSLSLDNGSLTVSESRFADLHLSPDSTAGIGGSFGGSQIHTIDYTYPDGTAEENAGLFYGFPRIYWDEDGSIVIDDELFVNKGIAFDMDKLKKIIYANKPEPRTFEEELEYWRSGAEALWHVSAELETDDYVILDMYQSGLPPGSGSGGEHWLMRLDRSPLGRQTLVSAAVTAPELYNSGKHGETDMLYYFKDTSLYRMNVFDAVEETVCSSTYENVIDYLKERWDTVYEYTDEYNSTKLLLRRDKDYRVYTVSDPGVTVNYRGGAEAAYFYNGSIIVKNNGQWAPDLGTEFTERMLAEGTRIEL